MSCENEIANILKEQALNYRLDPLLGKLCNAEIQTICAVQTDITASDGKVISNDIIIIVAHKGFTVRLAVLCNPCN